MLAEACETLCRLGGLPGLWDSAGPTDAAQLWRHRRPFRFPSRAAYALLTIAWELWLHDPERYRPECRLSFDQILDLEPATLAIVSGLLFAWSRIGQQLEAANAAGELGPEQLAKLEADLRTALEISRGAR